MVNSFLLLTDGSSYLVLTDGTSKLIISHERTQGYTFGGNTFEKEISYNFGGTINLTSTVPYDFGAETFTDPAVPSFLLLTDDCYLLNTTGGKMIIGEVVRKQYTFGAEIFGTFRKYNFGGLAKQVGIEKNYTFGAKVADIFTKVYNFGGNAVLQPIRSYTFGGITFRIFAKGYTFGAKVIKKTSIGYFFGGVTKDVSQKTYTFGTTLNVTNSKDYEFGGVAFFEDLVQSYTFGGITIRRRILPESKIYLTDKSEKVITI